MLCWLFHLVGDAHQPCHCSSLYAVKLLPQGDRGGNSVLLKDMAAENLHSFWDELLGKKATLAEASQHASSIAGDAALMQKADAAAAELDPQAWITEGSTVAKTSVYPPDIVAAVLGSESHSYEKNNYRYDAVGPLKLTPEQTTAYATNALEVARQQIAIAGVRLSKVLESLFHS
jgi:hypothetical protein